MTKEEVLKIHTDVFYGSLKSQMLELYPNRVNPGWALWSSARAVKS